MNASTEWIIQEIPEIRNLERIRNFHFVHTHWYLYFMMNRAVIQTTYRSLPVYGCWSAKRRTEIYNYLSIGASNTCYYLLAKWYPSRPITSRRNISLRHVRQCWGPFPLGSIIILNHWCNEHLWRRCSQCRLAVE